VAWCAGHLLETAPPEAYGHHYKRWCVGDLPMVPRHWKHEVLAPDLLRGIQGLLRDAARVVHAGDPDREGQLLVDEVLQFLGYNGPVDRLLVRDLRPEAIRRQLAALEPNAKYRALSESALARQRADWLYGINMTRLYTLLGRAAGYDGVLSVGRVQTPVLGLIVARDRAIAGFEPVPYFAVRAEIRAGGGGSFRASWVPGVGSSAAGADGAFDEERRLLKRAVAEAVLARVRGQGGAVTALTEDRNVEAPPLPYSLADLQVDAGRRLGLSAQAVLDACQSLYETHRLTTYPRSDCAYVPEGQHAQAANVALAIATNAPSLAAAVAKADLSLRSKAWNDRKVTAHHAIVPTPATGAPVAGLTDRERAVYELVGRRYLAQFYPAHQVRQTQVAIAIAGERFVANARQTVVTGWKALAADLPQDGANAHDPENPTEGEGSGVWPRLAPGERITVAEVAIDAKRTQAPRPFTDASLIAAMCGIAHFVSRPNLHKVLSDTDGLGTPATRAAILETLFERGYVTRVEKTIVSTATGRSLIAALPEVATTPDMTALWEMGLRAIAERDQTLQAFLDRIETELRELVQHGKTLARVTVAASGRVPLPGGRTASPRRKPVRSVLRTGTRLRAE
jgi:DNA topoisomerase-3